MKFGATFSPVSIHHLSIYLLPSARLLYSWIGTWSRPDKEIELDLNEFLVHSQKMKRGGYCLRQAQRALNQLEEEWLITIHRKYNSTVFKIQWHHPPGFEVQPKTTEPKKSTQSPKQEHQTLAVPSYINTIKDTTNTVVVSEDFSQEKDELSSESKEFQHFTSEAEQLGKYLCKINCIF